MERHSPSKLNPQIYAEACEWFVECRSGQLDEAMRRELDRWLRKSPEHLSAYLELAAIWNEGPSLDPEHRWDLDTLIAQAAEDHDNVISISNTATITPASQARSTVSAWRGRWIGASIAAACAVLSVVVWLLLSSAPTYSTQIGEQRSIVLADGSTIELNSRSKVRVRYSERERALDLIEGQALFHVAKDRQRPFIVSSDSVRVRAVGTQFDVNKKRSGTIVTVVEGRVAVLTGVADLEVERMAMEPPVLPMPSTPALAENETPQGASSRIFLSAGEQVTVTQATVQEVAHPNINSAIAWRQRQLIFEAASLTAVAEEFNRYNARQLVVLDPELYDFHISGVFSSTDPSALLQFLRERAGVQVIETETEIQLLKKPREEVTNL
jgi:transmembrane sensor